MSKKKSRKHRSIKRLKHHYRQPLKTLPHNIINENLFTQSKYNKYFDYSLPELLADHSTNPMQNTARQYILSDISNVSRFVNHEMIIRKNGESRILRPKYDIVLDNGFSPIIRPYSYLLSSYQSMPLCSQIASAASSIINKMSVNKSEEKIVNKRKQKYNRSPLTVKEGLNDITKEKNYLQQRIPFQDLSSKFSNNHQNQSLIQKLEDICFNRNTIDKQQSKNDDVEFSYDLPLEECFS